MSKVDRLARDLVALEGRLKAAETQPQFGYSSLEDGRINEYNIDGQIVQIIGKQFDGTHGSIAVSGPKPPTPSGLTLQPYDGGLQMLWDGTFVGGVPAPMDFSRVEFHVDTVPFVPDVAGRIRGTVETPRGADVVAPLPPTLHYVRLVCRSFAGVASDPSGTASATPGKVQLDPLPKGFIAGSYVEVSTPLSTTEYGIIGVGWNLVPDRRYLVVCQPGRVLVDTAETEVEIRLRRTLDGGLPVITSPLIHTEKYPISSALKQGTHTFAATVNSTTTAVQSIRLLMSIARASTLGQVRIDAGGSSGLHVYDMGVQSGQPIATINTGL